MHLIIDANAMVSKAFFVSTKHLGFKGNDFEFWNMLRLIFKQIKPTHVSFCFDSERYDRRDFYPDYKGKRVPNPDRNAFIADIRKALEAADFATYQMLGAEADDLCYTLSLSGDSVIVTADQDLFSAITNTTKVLYIAGKFAKRELVGVKEFVEKFGFEPELMPTYKGLVGDSSDNYGGVKGIGPKAAGLLLTFGDFDAIYGSLDEIHEINPKLYEKLVKGQSQGELAYALAKLANYSIIKTDSKLSKLKPKQGTKAVRAWNLRQTG